MLSQLTLRPTELRRFLELLPWRRGARAEQSFPFIRSDLLLNYGAIRNLHRQRAGSRGQPSLDAARQSRWHRCSIVRRTFPTSPSETENAYLRLDFGSRYRQQRHVDRWKHRRPLRQDGPRVDAALARTTTSMPIRKRPPRRTAPRTPDAESHDDPRDFLPETTAFLEQAATPIVVDQNTTRTGCLRSTSSGT